MSIEELKKHCKETLKNPLLSLKAKEEHELVLFLISFYEEYTFEIRKDMICDRNSY
jgi:hypothetical protein